MQGKTRKKLGKAVHSWFVNKEMLGWGLGRARTSWSLGQQLQELRILSHTCLCAVIWSVDTAGKLSLELDVLCKMESGTWDTFGIISEPRKMLQSLQQGGLAVP